MLLLPRVRRCEDELLLPSIPVATVGELATILANLPPNMPLAAKGSDSGGYDCITGREVFVDIIDGAFSIAHVDADDRKSQDERNEWYVNYNKAEENEDGEETDCDD